jgi:phosphate transport system substrate-binding protein
MKGRYYFQLIILALSFVACDSPQNPLAYVKDTHGRGKAMIYVEESFKPLFETSISTFESLNPKADLTSKYLPEGKIIQAFFDGKVKTITITRDFTKAEKKFLKSKNVEVSSDRIALDAVALIVNPENTDTTISIPRLRKILTDKNSVWTTSKQPISVVFDQMNSANFNYITDMLQTKNLASNVFAAKSNEEVINYVKKNKNAIGIIGLNWISNQEDFEVLNFLDGIHVMDVKLSEESESFKPINGYIYTKEYPLIRDVWMINKGSRSGLNSGFVNFMVGEKGQIIIHKSELVPANNPVRLIQMSPK